MQRLVIATSNAGKLREYRALLAPLAIEIDSLAALGIDSPAETGDTFIDNALLKARHAALHSGRATLADDSGLEVDALGGAPGVHSARYASSSGEGDGEADNIGKLLRALAGVATAARTARFQCAVVLLRSADDPAPLLATGCWEGRILEAPRGAGGFGYDPVFLDAASGCSAAELDSATKNARSHRGQALRQLLTQLSATS